MSRNLHLGNFAIGILKLFVVAGVIFYAIRQEWTQTFLMAVIFAAITIASLVIVAVRELLDNMLKAIVVL